MPERSKFTILGTKLEVRLAKAHPGHWLDLTPSGDSPPPNKVPAYPTSKRCGSRAAPMRPTPVVKAAQAGMLRGQAWLIISLACPNARASPLAEGRCHLLRPVLHAASCAWV